jgi:hypothetical protein
MRALGVLSLLCSASFGQMVEAPAEIRGVLLEHDPGVTGELAVRSPDHFVFRYRFDAHTAVEREGQSLDVYHLRPGDQIELSSDPANGPLRYARAIVVKVAVPTPTGTAHRTAPASHIRPYNAEEERLRQKGDLTFSGVIASLTGARLVLRTRQVGEQTILLRQDTRYLENGELVAAASLKPNMRVFVRAGKNIYGDVEGYQVVWGNILEVH